MNIDFSQIQPPAPQEQSTWEPPRRVFFGKRTDNGKRELEPESNDGRGARQHFPAIVYGMVNKTITAKVVNSEAEKKALGAEWKDTPAAFGYVGAPDFETALKAA